MIVVTLRDLIKERIAWCLANYPKYPRDSITNSKVVGEALEALGKLDPETCTLDDLEQAINGRFVGNICDECERTVPVFVRFGDDDEDTFGCQDICLDCLEKAVSLVRST